jgi:hypothetical protein
MSRNPTKRIGAQMPAAAYVGNTPISVLGPHQQDRRHQHEFAAKAISEDAKDNAADGTDCEAEKIGAEAGDQPNGRVLRWETQWAEYQRRGEIIERKIIVLKRASQ